MQAGKDTDWFFDWPTGYVRYRNGRREAWQDRDTPPSRPLLTDAERDAIEAAANAYQRRFDDGVGLLNDGPSECAKIAATLRWLLDRTK